MNPETRGAVFVFAIFILACVAILAATISPNLTMERQRLVDDMKDPPCPECGCMMWLKRIEPNKPGHDERTFECSRCLYVESLVVKFG